MTPGSRESAAKSAPREHGARRNEAWERQGYRFGGEESGDARSESSSAGGGGAEAAGNAPPHLVPNLRPRQRTPPPPVRIGVYLSSSGLRDGTDWDRGKMEAVLGTATMRECVPFFKLLYVFFFVFIFGGGGQKKKRKKISS